jgi:hypothetical protein
MLELKSNSFSMFSIVGEETVKSNEEHREMQVSILALLVIQFYRGWYQHPMGKICNAELVFSLVTTELLSTAHSPAFRISYFLYEAIFVHLHQCSEFPH